MDGVNFDLKEEIRDYWSKRSETFDLAFGHRIAPGQERLRFILADAENTLEPDASYDAIICRHLVWTLTRPEEAFREWFRILKPGGLLLFFDGDWASPK